MNKKIIKDELQWLLEAINEQYETLKNFEEKVPRIEFDILMDNLRKFYDNMRLLQRLDDHQPEPVAKSASRFTEPLVVREQPASRPVQPAPSKPVLSPDVTVKYEKPPVSAGEAPSPDSGPRGISRKENPLPPRKTVKPDEIDLFAAEEPVFSIKLKEAREKSLGPKSPNTRTDNLKSIISINEKFMFINELFDGNLREYNETIEMLSGFTNRNHASEYLENMVKKNYWDTGSDAFKKLSELMERRF